MLFGLFGLMYCYIRDQTSARWLEVPIGRSFARCIAQSYTSAFVTSLTAFVGLFDDSAGLIIKMTL